MGANYDYLLKWAYDNNREDMSDYLIASGENGEGIEIRCLYFSCQYGATDVVTEILTWVGIDLSDHSEELIRLAAKFGYYQIVQAFIDAGFSAEFKNNYIFHLAISNQDLNLISTLALAGYDVTFDNNNALRTAVKNDNVSMVQTLLINGADSSCENNYCLSYAALNGFLDVINALISDGIDVTYNDNFAVKWANTNGHADVVTALENAGAVLP